MSSTSWSGIEPSIVDRVPVALVEVIAGADRRVGDAQLLGQLRLALQAHLSDRSPAADSANILPATLNTEGGAPNGNSSAAPGKPRQWQARLAGVSNEPRD